MISNEANGSLTAAIVMNSLDPSDPIAGVEPTINTNPARVTIRDDDMPVFVSITTLEGEASTTISEADDEITLRLALSRDINQLLEVTLNSVGDSRLVAGVPAVVEVSSNTRTQDFTVAINDIIVAQPDRNIDISVVMGMGYIPSTDVNTVSVDVIDDDTATVTISPVSESITGGDEAKFNVILGLVTAVDVEIGIKVEFGGDFITDDDRGLTTVTVLAGGMSTRLSVQTMENMGTAVNSSLVATLVAVSHTDLEIGTPSSARVEINALSPLSITATPTVLSLVEGGASTEINVRLSRIPEGSDSVTVMINLQEGSELTVMPSSLELEFTDTQTRTVMVRAEDGIVDEYMANRSETLRFTADNYATAMVTVEITDDEPQPIGLEVRSSTDLDLVAFETADITVSVDVTTTLNVVTEGSVRLEGGSMAGTFGLDAGEETQIQIEAVSVGDGTVTFTVGEGETADTAVVTVMVSRSLLTISADEDELMIETLGTAEFIVSVRAELGRTG